MSSVVQELLNRVMALSPEERDELLSQLAMHVDEPPATDQEQAVIDAAWRDEIDRRVTAYRNGDARLIAADDVYARIRKRERR